MADDDVPMVENAAAPKTSDSEPLSSGKGGLERTIGLVGCAALLVGTIIGIIWELFKIP